jgi:ectoine hydroxylase-related dioxygenase (phytanoyl-CoA dioxygenase family)
MSFQEAALEADYRRDGVIRVRRLFAAEKVAELRQLLSDYIAEKVPTLPPSDRTFEADGKTVRNLWRIEQHDPRFTAAACTPELLALVAKLVNGEPVLAAIETFNKPARIGSGVPYHQDNAYFCQSPPDMLTVWVAMDAATLENGPVYYISGSHTQGVLPTKKSGVAGNSMGMAVEPTVPLSEQFCGTLEPGDALIHHCQTIHHSAPNKSDHSRLGLLLVFRGSHTQIDPALQAAYRSPA